MSNSRIVERINGICYSIYPSLEPLEREYSKEKVLNALITAIEWALHDKYKIKRLVNLLERRPSEFSDEQIQKLIEISYWKETNYDKTKDLSRGEIERILFRIERADPKRYLEILERIMQTTQDLSVFVRVVREVSHRVNNYTYLSELAEFSAEKTIEFCLRKKTDVHAPQERRWYESFFPDEMQANIFIKKIEGYLEGVESCTWPLIDAMSKLNYSKFPAKAFAKIFQKSQFTTRHMIIEALEHYFRKDIHFFQCENPQEILDLLVLASKDPEYIVRKTVPEIISGIKTQMYLGKIEINKENVEKLVQVLENLEKKGDKIADQKWALIRIIMIHSSKQPSPEFEEIINKLLRKNTKGMLDEYPPYQYDEYKTPELEAKFGRYAKTEQKRFTNYFKRKVKRAKTSGEVKQVLDQLLERGLRFPKDLKASDVRTALIRYFELGDPEKECEEVIDTAHSFFNSHDHNYETPEVVEKLKRYYDKISNDWMAAFENAKTMEELGKVLYQITEMEVIPKQITNERIRQALDKYLELAQENRKTKGAIGLYKEVLERLNDRIKFGLRDVFSSGKIPRPKRRPGKGNGKTVFRLRAVSR